MTIYYVWSASYSLDVSLSVWNSACDNYQFFLFPLYSIINRNELDRSFSQKLNSWNRPFPSFVLPLCQNESCQNVPPTGSFSYKLNSFPYERFCTKIRFETEVQGNWKITYCKIIVKDSTTWFLDLHLSTCWCYQFYSGMFDDQLSQWRFLFTR